MNNQEQSQTRGVEGMKMSDLAGNIAPRRQQRANSRVSARAKTEKRLASSARTIAVIGFDQVGLPLALQLCRAGASVIEIEAREPNEQTPGRGANFRAGLSAGTIAAELGREAFRSSTEFSDVSEADTIVLCAGGVLNGEKDPNLSDLLALCQRLAPHLGKGKLIVVDSVRDDDPACSKIRQVLENATGGKDGFDLIFFPPESILGSPSASAASILLLNRLKMLPTAPSLTAPGVFKPERLMPRALPSTASPRRRMDRSLAERLVYTAMVCDFIVVVYTLVCAFWLRFNTGIREIGIPSEVSLSDYGGYIALGALSLMAALSYFEVYDPRTLLRISHVNARMMKAGMWSFAIFLFAALFFEFRPPISRIFVLIAACTTTAGLMAWRTMFHSYLRKSSVSGNLQQRVLFVGWNEEARRLAHTFSVDICSAFSVTGCVRTPDSVPQVSNHRLARVLGSFDDIEEILERESVDTVIVADMKLPADDLLNLSVLCEKDLIAFKIIPSYFKILVSGLHLETMSGIPVLGVSRLPLDRFINVLSKRAVDIVGSIVGLVLSAPLIAFFGFLVYRECPGPILYRQRRLGHHGKNFNIIKIRSMRPDAEQDGAVGWTTKEDPRRLKIGSFMRKWNIDELPQFWNVLCGQMSLVGPRPERPELIAEFKEEIPHYHSRHNIKPGMTGWAQIKGLRGDTDLVERIKSDLFYLENWSLLLDFQIMAMTFCRNRNAC